jgi:hypothetical protein
LNIVLPVVANPLPCRYVIVVLVLLKGTLPAVTVPVVVLAAVAVYVLYVFVLGAASGAEADNNPATNLNLSDTFVSAVKLLKYEPFKLVCQLFDVGLPTFIFDACIDSETSKAYFPITDPSGEFNNAPLPVICILSFVA